MNENLIKNHRLSKRAFTLSELIVVIAIICVLVAILIPVMINYVNDANTAHDTETVKILNSATAAYATSMNTTTSDVFSDVPSDIDKMQLLYEQKYINTIPAAKSDNTVFLFSEDGIWIISEDIS